MPEKMTTLERAKEMLNKVKNEGYDPELAVYRVHDAPDVERVGMGDYAWVLSHPKYGYTHKNDAIGFFEMLIERLEKEE